MLLLLLLACDPGSQATHLCRARRDNLDTLYARYGGSDAAQGAKGGLLGDAIGELDRAHFEESCVEMGRGGRPSLLSKKAKAFFEEPATKQACKQIVDVEDKVKAINRELPADAQVTCP